MKVLFTISCLSYGGAEKNLVIVANYLAQKHRVAICNFNEHETKQALDGRIKCYDAQNKKNEKEGRFSWIIKRKKQYKFLKKICVMEKPDIIISFLPIPNALAVLCGNSLGIPVVISERADPYQCMSRLDGVLHRIYEKADGAVFQTTGAKAFYKDSLQKKSIVIPNPIMIKGTNIEHNYIAVKKEIVSVGRFENVQKRQDVLLKAVKIVFETYPEYRLVLWGDGPDEKMLKDLAKNLGIENKVVFAGVTHETLNKINGSEIFVLSSDYEGIPNVLMEAMSIGMPCIATDCSPGGARMLLRNGADGKLVECGDYKSLAREIIDYISNKDIEINYGQKAKKILYRFSYDEIMTSWESYLTEIIKK